MTSTLSNTLRQFYQINAERIKVLAKPLPDKLSTTSEPSSNDDPKPKTFDDFALFTSKKRKEDEPPERQSTPKRKVHPTIEPDYDMMNDK